LLIESLVSNAVGARILLSRNHQEESLEIGIVMRAEQRITRTERIASNVIDKRLLASKHLLEEV
jgi:hypothetical protein